MMKSNHFCSKYIVQAITIVLAVTMIMSPISALADEYNGDAGSALTLVEHSTNISGGDTEFFAQVVTDQKDVEANQVVQKEETVEITDEDVALAPTLPANERPEMSWWWLFIIAICGVTSYVWYRNHQRQMESEDLDIL